MCTHLISEQCVASDNAYVYMHIVQHYSPEHLLMSTTTLQVWCTPCVRRLSLATVPSAPHAMRSWSDLGKGPLTSATCLYSAGARQCVRQHLAICTVHSSAR